MKYKVGDIICWPEYDRFWQILSVNEKQKLYEIKLIVPIHFNNKLSIFEGFKQVEANTLKPSLLILNFLNIK